VVLVIARFRPRHDRLEEFTALLQEVQTASRADDGCLNYGYHAEVGDPLQYVAVEEWRDMDALREHLRTPHVARLIAALPEFADGPLDIAAHSVAESGPLPLPR
jgi:quinol monooxygenase YgiN